MLNKKEYKQKKPLNLFSPIAMVKTYTSCNVIQLNLTNEQNKEKTTIINIEIEETKQTFKYIHT